MISNDTRYLALVIAIAILLPFAGYLTLRFMERVAALRNQLGDLHLLWYKVSRLNEQVVAKYKAKGQVLEKAGKEPPYKELGT
jgi:hypothetical protein